MAAAAVDSDADMIPKEWASIRCMDKCDDGYVPFASRFTSASFQMHGFLGHEAVGIKKKIRSVTTYCLRIPFTQKTFALFKTKGRWRDYEC